MVVIYGNKVNIVLIIIKNNLQRITILTAVGESLSYQGLLFSYN